MTSMYQANIKEDQNRPASHFQAVALPNDIIFYP